MKSEPSEKKLKRKNVGDHLSFSEKRIHRVSAEIRCQNKIGLYIHFLPNHVADFRIELSCTSAFARLVELVQAVSDVVALRRAPWMHDRAQSDL